MKFDRLEIVEETKSPKKKTRSTDCYERIDDEDDTTAIKARVQSMHF